MINQNNPENNILSSKSDILHAIKMLDDTKIKLILVVDDNKMLIGTITDGDIRRALIKNNDLNILCENIMNPKPIFAYANDKEGLESKLEEYKIPIPIISKDSLIISICTIGTKTYNSHNNIVVIMAGGKGERLLPLTSSTPKPMLPIHNKPIIHRIVDNNKKYGFKNISISINYKGEQLIDYFKDGKDFGVDISYLKEDKPLGTAGALSLLDHNNLTKPIILMNGDVLTGVNVSQLLEFHQNAGKDITMCAANYNVAVPYGTIEVEGTVITDIVEKPLKSYLVNAGIYVINPNIIKKMKPNMKIDMTTLINQYVSERSVSIYPLHEHWIDIGSHEDYEKAQK
ncbi:nucleotidyltransferase family protein [Gammaproteobacteria bacterium]|nr:nucleotidyltransferase family protein [Gammaproteobacteria bacterium]